ncbi:MAG: DUF5615 family PIN-like protein [Verrucomicrobiales bacterium]|nr:DUF5615 family PIN-like protein [Verrucomicrobiales bacterium]
MKWLLDQGVPRSTGVLLRQAGWDVLHTGEIGMASAEDKQILARAAAENRIIVTLDADFHALLALSQVQKPSVVRVRIEGLSAQELSRLLQKVARQCQAELEAGAMVSVHPDRIRIRRLPIS